MLYKLTSTRVFRFYTGGKYIDDLTGVASPAVSSFPEDWLGSVTSAINPGRNVPGEGLSKTEDGRYLKDIIEENREEMLGEHREMKLLCKLLDAAERLAIQAHPTVPFALEHFHSSFGKTECWYLLNDGGSVYLGFRPGITKEYWKQLFNQQNIEGMLQCLHHFEVKKGDMIFIEGGVPHAIGEGCLLAELQEPSDLVVCVERVTPSGIEIPERKQHGGLGYEKMFDVFHYDGMTREEVEIRYFLKPQYLEEGRELLVGPDVTDKFRLERLEINGCRKYAVSEYGIVLVTEGTGKINGISLTAGDRLFVPASEKILDCCGCMKLLFCSP